MYCSHRDRQCYQPLRNATSALSVSVSSVHLKPDTASRRLQKRVQDRGMVHIVHQVLHDRLQDRQVEALPQLLERMWTFNMLDEVPTTICSAKWPWTMASGGDIHVQLAHQSIHTLSAVDTRQRTIRHRHSRHNIHFWAGDVGIFQVFHRTFERLVTSAGTPYALGG